MEFGIFAYGDIDRWRRMDGIGVVASCMMFDGTEQLTPTPRWWKLHTADVLARGRELWGWGWMQPNFPRRFVDQLRRLTDVRAPAAFVLNAEIRSRRTTSDGRTIVSDNWTGASDAQVEDAIAGVRGALPGVPVYLSSHGYPKDQMPSSRFARLVDGVTPQGYDAERRYPPDETGTFMDRCVKRWRVELTRNNNAAARLFLTLGVNKTDAHNFKLNARDAERAAPGQPIMLWSEGGLSEAHASVIAELRRSSVSPTERPYLGPEEPEA